MSTKTIFLDRDGVINKETNYLYKIKDFVFIDGVFKSCLYLQDLGYKIIIITNQSGIGRGYYGESDYKKITDWMIEEFNKRNINILDVFHCPHHPEENCSCRKPKPGMFLMAEKKYGLKLKESWLIGDNHRDIEAANKANIVNTILVKSGHKIDEESSKALFTINSIKNVHEVIKN